MTATTVVVVAPLESYLEYRLAVAIWDTIWSALGAALGVILPNLLTILIASFLIAEGSHAYYTDHRRRELTMEKRKFLESVVQLCTCEGESEQDAIDRFRLRKPSIHPELRRFARECREIEFELNDSVRVGGLQYEIRVFHNPEGSHPESENEIRATNKDWVAILRLLNPHPSDPPGVSVSPR